MMPNYNFVLICLGIATIIFALAFAFHIVVDIMDEHMEKKKRGKI